MKLVKAKETSYIPLAHTNSQKPEAWKKVLFTHSDLVTGKIQMINWAKLPSGNRVNAHYHQSMQEIFIILKGTVSMTIDKAKVILEKGDAIAVPIKSVHAMKNIGKTEVLYITLG